MTIDERLDAITHSLELVAQGHAKMENVLRRAVAAGVKETRNQRKRSRKLDEKITQLASAQLVTEEKVSGLDEKMTELANAQVITQQLFQAWLKRGSNGQH